MKKVMFLFILSLLTSSAQSQNQRPRDLGLKIGVMQSGPYNAITDVKGVKVGQVSLIEGDDIRTGVTAILAHEEDHYQNKVPAAIYIGNGYGKLAGYSQVKELGNLETPIVLTNTLSVPTVCNALITHCLSQEGNENVRSVNSVVGETNDGYLNDIRGRHVKEAHVLSALEKASSGMVEEGNVGAGTGTVCFGWKGGIGTASRVLPKSLGAYRVGVLVQTNFGGVLQIDGVPIGEELGQYAYKDPIDQSADGSCMIVVATDAPLTARNLERLAKRAFLGLAKTGGIASNGSGDYIIAFSTAESVRIRPTDRKVREIELLKNSAMSPLFMAAIEATEEAVINSLFAAKTTKGRDGHQIEALPKQEVLSLLKKYGAIERSSEK